LGKGREGNRKEEGGKRGREERKREVGKGRKKGKQEERNRGRKWEGILQKLAQGPVRCKAGSSYVRR